MAEQVAYYGGFGPVYYDDSIPLDPVLFPGLTQRALATTGAVRVGPPRTPEDAAQAGMVTAHGLRPLQVANIAAPDRELASLAGTVGTLLVAFQARAGENSFTLYVWDVAVAEGAQSPWVVPGLTGYWIAIGGHYSAATPIPRPPRPPRP